MDSDKYLEGQSMQRPPLFESDSFIYWKNRFETYVKSKDLDLWYVITNGDFQPIIQNPETKLDEVVPFEKQTDDLKRRLAKNNEAKMVIYNALPIKELNEFSCVTRQKKMENLLITHQGQEKLKGNLLHKTKKEFSVKSCSDFGSEDEEYAHGGGEEDDEKVKNETCLVAHASSESDSGEEDDEKVKGETCLVAHASSEICLGVDLKPEQWIKDSGCSKHMMGNRKLFSTYKAYNGGNVIFGSNLCGNIIGKGTISNDSFKIDNVEHVDNLGFNLLSIRQICDNKCRVTFSEYDSEIIKDGKVIGHANMRLIQSLASKELVRNLSELKY
ncbi:retrovirus-related pol polyprotein from transposon TNT 1-94, partial [Tanacetum coccineum]